MSEIKNKGSGNQLIRRNYFTLIENRITEKYHELISADLINSCTKDMTHNLNYYGISFEGKSLPVSLNPNLLLKSEIDVVAETSSLIYSVLNKIIQKFVIEHRSKIHDGPLHRFFTPYYKWWDLIASEVRTIDYIQLMRFDATRDYHGQWSIMETNTACPGGTIHCARIRDAWLMTKLGIKVTNKQKIYEFEVDKYYGFVLHLATLAQQINSESPNIAILNYNGVYTNELVSLKNCYQELLDTGRLKNGEIILGDIKDIQIVNGQAFINDKPIALIYNKIDQLQIDPNNPEIQNWISASRLEKTQFLNSFGALYLTESKRILALMSDPKWSQYIELTENEENAISTLVPFTKLVEDYLSESVNNLNILSLEKNRFVLKADSLTRGSGVYIGDKTTLSDWKQKIQELRSFGGIAQMKCPLPTRQSQIISEKGELVEIEEFFGLDLFMFGNKFAGVVSRCHTNQVFNVGNGGKEVPVLILEDGND